MKGLKGRMVWNVDFVSRTTTTGFKLGIDKIRPAFIKINFITAGGKNCCGRCE